MCQIALFRSVTRFLIGKVALNLESVSPVLVEFLEVVSSIAAVFVALYVSYKASLPQVIAYLDFDEDHNLMYFVVENSGAGVAYDIRFLNFGEQIVQESLREIVGRSFIHNGVPVLAPGKIRRTLIAAGRMQDEMENYSAKVTVVYKEKSMFLRRNKTVKEPTVLEYRSYTGSLYAHSDMHEMKMSLDKIVNHTSSIASALKNMERFIKEE